jgi:hypothetical protein
VNLEEEPFLLPLLLCGPAVFFQQEPLLLIDGLPLLLLLFWLVYQIVPTNTNTMEDIMKVRETETYTESQDHHHHHHVISFCYHNQINNSYHMSFINPD